MFFIVKITDEARVNKRLKVRKVEEKYIIGVDIGTSSTKAVLFDHTGKLIHRHAISYDLITDDAGRAVQDPDTMVDAVKNAVRHVIDESAIPSEDVRAVSFSSAMHSLILVDETHQPLTPAITWADHRSTKAAEHLKKNYDSHLIYEKTGTPIHPMSPFVKISWLNQEQPELIAKTKIFADIKSYVFYQLFHEWVIDESLASGTGMYNPKEHDWEKEAMDIIGLKPGQLPRVVSETTAFHNDSTARDLGLTGDPAFVIGGSDGALANIGIQALGKNEVTVTVGTSGAVRKLVPEFQVDKAGRTFCYAAAGPYVIGGAVNNGGKVVEWAFKQFGKEEEDFSDFLKLSDDVPPGANGLMFLPFLLGGRAPLWRNNLFGDFIGLTINHTRKTMVRAILEGIALNLADVYEAIAEKEDIIYVTGGLASEPLWCQMLADILEREVRVAETIEGSGLGAAIVGMKAIGWLETLEIGHEKRVAQTFSPRAEYRDRYRDLRNLFNEANQRLLTTYENIIAWKEKYQEI